MPYCTECGNLVAPDAQFCPQCGKPKPGLSEKDRQFEKRMESLEGCGQGLQQLGCALILLVTIPLLLGMCFLL